MRASTLLLMSLLLPSCVSISDNNLNASVVALYTSYSKLSDSNIELCKIKSRFRSIIYNIDKVDNTKTYRNKYYDLLDVYELIKIYNNNFDYSDIDLRISNFDYTRYIITKSDILDLIFLTNMIIKAIPV